MVTVEGFYESVEGVRGKALKSDGFTTMLSFSNPDFGSSVDYSVSAWVALDTYGWNDVAIVDGRNGQNLDWGIYLGINSEGFPVFGIAIEGSWKVLTGNKQVNLYEWTQVCAVYDHQRGMRLVLNGQEIGFREITGIPSISQHVTIARNSFDMTPDHVHRPYGAFPAKYSLDGIIDEVSVYGTAKSTEALNAMYLSERPAGKPPITQRYLPKGPAGLPNDFNAYTTQLQYYPAYDAVWRSDAPQDIVITFENLPVRIVAWKGIRFAPSMVLKNNSINNDIWIADQSAEYFAGIPRPGGTYGCCEHMSDAQCRYSRVNLIENNAARKVIHWRYAPTDVQYKLPYANELTGWSTWIDEYYYVYPDGVYTRGYHSFNDDNAPIDQYQETTMVNPPRTYPEDNVEKAAITLADQDGHEQTYVRKENFRRTEFPGLTNPNIQLLNVKANFKPFIIMDPRAVYPMLYLWNTGINSYFSMWNHFPVAQQAPTDGRQAVYNDRSSSTAFSWMKMTAPYKEDRRKKVYVYLTGATDKHASELSALSKSWNQAPEFTLQKGRFIATGYEKFERAYLFVAGEKNHGSLVGKLDASPGSPAENLVLRIEKWSGGNATVKIDGKLLDKRQYRCGYEQTMQGTRLIVFVYIKQDRPFSITVETE